MNRPTEYGKYVKELRKNRNENLEIMAKKLDVSISFLSLIESGKKKIPDGFILKLISVYNLNVIETKKLYNAIDLTNLESKISLNNLSNDKKTLILYFARNINDLDDSFIDQIINMIKK